MSVGKGTDYRDEATELLLHTSSSAMIISVIPHCMTYIIDYKLSPCVIKHHTINEEEETLPPLKMKALTPSKLQSEKASQPSRPETSAASTLCHIC